MAKKRKVTRKKRKARIKKSKKLSATRLSVVTQSPTCLPPVVTIERFVGPLVPVLEPSACNPPSGTNWGGEYTDIERKFEEELDRDSVAERIVASSLPVRALPAIDRMVNDFDNFKLKPYVLKWLRRLACGSAIWKEEFLRVTNHLCAEDRQRLVCMLRSMVYYILKPFWMPKWLFNILVYVKLMSALEIKGDMFMTQLTESKEASVLSITAKSEVKNYLTETKS